MSNKQRRNKKAIFRKFAATAATTSLLVSPLAPAMNAVADTITTNEAEINTEQVVEAPETELPEEIGLPETMEESTENSSEENKIENSTDEMSASNLVLPSVSTEFNDEKSIMTATEFPIFSREGSPTQQWRVISTENPMFPTPSQSWGTIYRFAGDQPETIDITPAQLTGDTQELEELIFAASGLTAQGANTWAGIGPNDENWNPSWVNIGVDSSVDNRENAQVVVDTTHIATEGTATIKLVNSANEVMLWDTTNDFLAHPERPNLQAAPAMVEVAVSVGEITQDWNPGNTLHITPAEASTLTAAQIADMARLQFTGADGTPVPLTDKDFGATWEAGERNIGEAIDVTFNVGGAEKTIPLRIVAEWPVSPLQGWETLEDQRNPENWGDWDQSWTSVFRLNGTNNRVLLTQGELEMDAEELQALILERANVYGEWAELKPADNQGISFNPNFVPTWNRFDLDEVGGRDEYEGRDKGSLNVDTSDIEDGKVKVSILNQNNHLLYDVDRSFMTDGMRASHAAAGELEIEIAIVDISSEAVVPMTAEAFDAISSDDSALKEAAGLVVSGISEADVKVRVVEGEENEESGVIRTDHEVTFSYNGLKTTTIFRTLEFATTTDDSDDTIQQVIPVGEDGAAAIISFNPTAISHEDLSDMSQEDVIEEILYSSGFRLFIVAANGEVEEIEGGDLLDMIELDGDDLEMFMNTNRFFGGTYDIGYRLNQSALTGTFGITNFAESDVDGQIPVTVSGYDYRLTLTEEEVDINQNEVADNDTDFKAQLLELIQPQVERKYHDTDGVGEWEEHEATGDFELELPAGFSMEELQLDEQFDVTVRYTVFADPNDEDAGSKVIDKEAKVTINSSMFSDVDAERVAMSLDEAVDADWNDVFATATPIAIKGYTDLNAEIINVTVPFFDGEEGVYNAIFEVKIEGEKESKYINMENAVTIIDTDGGRLAMSDDLRHFAVSNDPTLALTDIDEETIDETLADSVTRVIQAVDITTPVSRFAGNGETPRMLEEVENPALEFDTEELLALDTAHEGLDVAFYFGPDEVEITPTRASTSQLPGNGTMTVAVTADELSGDTGDDEVDDETTNGDDDTIVTGGDNVDTGTGKNLPSTGEMASTAGLFGAALLGLSGLTAWLKKRRNSGK
ncbi:LPXTG cell wall anchor domain-containing protein [Lactococcus protaetiae]|uniref:LPXTG cell wall anchor domain-containing protein n=1 Tax=Lactococcus protaetiae TaxID=2592653 RepID=A0A514ZB16_9LACT|nr:LPXTG cell wall anchor domain-containing protein [Lactococcus protaetiae]QDK71765.1 LPXTG cell wall anchor domain-containing protein [Lactococcus protaetiae]